MRGTTEPTPDYGDDLGPAAKARESAMCRIAGESTGSASPPSPVYVRRYACECVIDWLNAPSRGYITDRQWRAGIMFRRKWSQATSKQRVTANYARVGGRGVNNSDDAFIAACAAEMAITDAMKAMGTMRGNVVISVAGHDEKVGRRMATLREGLDIVADLWDVPLDYNRYVKGRNFSAA